MNAESGMKTPELLVFTTLYPNAAQPSHGVFVENRLRFLLASGRASARVLAPAPWFPSAAGVFGRYASYARIPRREVRHGIALEHPRYPVIPKFGMQAAPDLLFAAMRPHVARMLRERPIDVIDAHYFYPDGVAAAMLGEAFGVPVTITARGTDLNLIMDRPGPRRRILWAAERAAGLIAVCEALKNRLTQAGVPAERVRVLRNGVDLGQFAPAERKPARRALSLTRPTLLSVGHLIERKGHDLVVAAMALLPQAELLIVGDGPEEGALKALAGRLGVADRVRFLGRVPHEKLPALYSAADVAVLASSREGWANVLLESMACGTPVAASAVWGTPEIVTAPEAGLLLRERSPQAIAEAVEALLADPPDRKATRAYAERFSWDATTAGQLELFGDILRSRRAAA